MRAAALLLVSVACSSSDALGPDGIRSGTRLRATFLADADGARAFTSFHDVALDVDCTWRTGDGARCLPAYDHPIGFRDDACTYPIAVSYGACDGPPRYVAGKFDPCSGDPRSLWEVVGQIAPPAVVYQHDSYTGECFAVQADPGLVYYGVVAEAPMDGFAGGSIAVEGDGRLRTRVIQGDDGSRLPIGAYDGELGADCSLSQDLMRCVPAHAGSCYTEDAACNVPVVTALDVCDPPAYIARWRWTLELHERGDEVAPAELYLQHFAGEDGWSCEATEADIAPGWTAYRAGAAVDLETLAPLSRALDDGARLQSWWIEGDGHRRFDGFFDRALGADCWPTEVAPGDWRCLPPLPTAWSGYHYADAACTTLAPAVVSFYDQAPTSPVVEWTSAGVCGQRARLHALGPEIAPATLYAMLGGQCLPQTWDTSRERLFTLGPALSFETYAALSTYTE